MIPSNSSYLYFLEIENNMLFSKNNLSIAPYIILLISPNSQDY